MLVPAAFATLGSVELAVTRPPAWGYGVVLEVATAALLVPRRLFPLVLCPVAGAVLLAIPWTGPAMDQVSTPILFIGLICYTLARWVPGLRGLVGLAVLYLLVFADYVLADSRHHDITDVFFVAALSLPPYVFGRISRKIAAQSALLLEHQERERVAAIRAERDRIARDLHDVIAHSISAMVVQTAAAQDLVRVDPTRAEQLLAVVADTGRRALSETGQLLHVLRDDADELGLRPAPGLAEVPDLVRAFRVQGLAVEVDLPDPLPSVPAGVDVSAYRIAQEVLTNALRYAADRTVALRVAHTGPHLWIHASNASDGRTGLGSGLGLLGVGERVKVLGGTLRHGCADGREAVEVVRRTEPDVVLMDIRMPVLDGIAATEAITAAGLPARVLVLTTYDLDSYVYGALRVGAAGFLLKATPPDRLVAGIETVAAGEALLAPSLTRRLIEEHVRGPAPVDGVPVELAGLTEREREVLVLVARGLTNDEVAAALVVSEATVKTHVNRILAKVGLRTRVQLVVLAYECGLVRPGG